MKRPSDRKSATITVRLTRGERAMIRLASRKGESLSDTLRRLVFANITFFEKETSHG